MSTADTIALLQLIATCMTAGLVLMVTVILSKRQDRIAREALRFQHYERRFEAYVRIRGAVDDVLEHNGFVRPQCLRLLNEGKGMSQFLFDEDVNGPILQLSNRVYQRSWRQGVLPEGENDEHDKLMKKERDEFIDWMLTESGALEPRYDKYLSMRFY